MNVQKAGPIQSPAPRLDGVGLMDVSGTKPTPDEKKTLERLKKALQQGDTKELKAHIWDDSPLVSASAITSFTKLSLRTSERKVDEMGLIDLKKHGLTINPEAYETLLRLVRYGDATQHSNAFNQLADINQPIMADALKAQGITDPDPIVEKVLNEKPDTAPTEFQQVAQALTQQLGVYVSPSDLQLYSDSIKLSHRMPLALQRMKFDMEKMITGWNHRFNRIQDDFPPVEDNMLTVYGFCIDRTYEINQQNAQKFVDEGLKAAAEFDGKTKEETQAAVEALIKTDDPPKKAETATQFMGLVLRRMKYKVSDKSAVATPELDAWIEDTFEWMGPRDKSGGASANIAVNLPREPNIVMAVEHNNQIQAQTMPEQVKRFSTADLETGQFKSLRDKKDKSPLQINHPFEFDKGVKFTLGAEEITTPDNGRMIMGASGVYENRADKDPKNWHQSDKPSPFLLDDSGAPITDEGTLKKIGEKFKKVIFNGLHYLKKEDFETMRKQIDGVKVGGAITHVELSGINSADLESLKYMSEVLMGRVDSMAFNDGETVTVLNALQKHLPQAKDVRVDLGEGSEAQMENGIQIAKLLGLRRLHIHGQDFDVILRQDASEADLQSEVVGGMWQKYQIYKKLTGESVQDRDVPPNLKKEAMLELMKYAAKFTAGLGVERLNEIMAQEKTSPEEIDECMYEMIESMALNGHIRNQTKGGYSIVLLPPKWIYGERKIYPTGAGDTASGNQFAYSGFYSRKEDSEGWIRKASIGSYF
jgi:ADP-dependent phosphofructokinase/glucokinase